MHAVENATRADFVPASTRICRPTVSLTERGARLLACLAARELLPESSTTVAAVIDRRIDALLGGGDADRAYRVTIICDELNMRETVTVQAADEWKARTEAMVLCSLPLAGQHVEYEVHHADHD